MTLKEARNLKVGDMVVYYDARPYIEPGYTCFTEVVDGKVRAADLGLVIKLESGEVLIDWLEESRDFTVHKIDGAAGGGWENIEKV